MDFNLICAVSLNGVIGDSTTNSIPWHIPADLKRFKALTTGHTIVMGAKTYASLGRKLPNRRNVVITRGGTPLPYDADATYSSIPEVLRHENNFFVVGGEHIFGEMLRYGPTRLYMTIIHQEIAGDVRFPFDGRRLMGDVIHDAFSYRCEERSEIMEENSYNFSYATFKR